MANRTYALVGRRGDDGGRYVVSQWPQMKERAWAMVQAGDIVQVWRASSMCGDLYGYDGEATRRVTDHIVKMRANPPPKGIPA